MKLPRPIFASCVILVLAQATVAISRPQQRAGVITGVVIDSSTSEPLDNAIVYIPNSGIGTSTGADGSFMLPRLSGGEYDIIVSRVGYLREKLHLSLGEDDSLTLVIPLTARPVRAPGIEVFSGPETVSASAPLFFPDGGEKSWCAYGSETEIPIGILFAGKSMYMYALETAMEGGEKDIRFWLLVYNGSEDTLTFDAGRDIRLDMKAGGKTYHNVRPNLPAGSTGDETGSITAGMQFPPAERTLGVMAAQSTFFIDAAFRFDLAAATFGAAPFPWLGWLNPQEHPAGVNPRHLKDVYDKCTHGGTLGRYRIFPAGGVDGVLRFPLPGFHAVESAMAMGEAYTYTYVFVLQTPSGEERIVFTAH
ncbi:MAG TPA: carboxypeptidase-like regulatory domain-containing protein [Bacteroidota bacterium]|nr:carboxypeptidase-like regulatory domain-containing protein [Bacteroidota bacterium]